METTAGLLKGGGKIEGNRKTHLYLREGVKKKLWKSGQENVKNFDFDFWLWLVIIYDL